ncbi:MAG: hypothetical protein ABFD07_16545 [Methanobacterium sp.]
MAGAGITMKTLEGIVIKTSDGYPVVGKDPNDYNYPLSAIQTTQKTYTATSIQKSYTATSKQKIYTTLSKQKTYTDTPYQKTYTVVVDP